MIGFPECRHERRKKCGCTKAGTQRFKCLECGKRFTASTRTLAGSERFNLSIRMGMRRFTRLTNGFSRSHAHHEAALALFFMHYNYCAMHGTLGTTPAVAAGLTEKQWTVAEMIERTASYRKPEPKPPTWGEFLDTLPDE